MAAQGAFVPSDELAIRIERIASLYPERMAAVLPALHAVQLEVGWVPLEAQKWVAGKLGVPAAHVHGCVSFYTLLRPRPLGRHHIQVCRTLSCELRGAGGILEHLRRRLGIEEGGVTPDGQFSLETVECLGSCGTAPVMQVNDDYHENLTPESIDELLDRLR
jgi:NADH-quinone oxidoreductase subunit E